MSFEDRAFVEFCGKARDNQLSPDEFVVFEKRLMEDRDAREFYLKFVQVQSVLERYGGEMLKSDLVADELSAGATRLEKLASHGFRLNYQWLSIAASLLLLAALSYVFISQLDTPPAKGRDQDTVVIDQSRVNQVVQSIAMLDTAYSTVIVTRGEKQETISRGGQFALQVGDVISTNHKSSAIISYQREATAIIMSTNSSMRLGYTKAGGKHVRLYEGYLACHVDRQKAGKKMVLSTPEGEVAVLGTQFVLSAEAGATQVDVTEGKVRVALSGKQETVTTGESLAVQKNKVIHKHRFQVSKQSRIQRFVLIDTNREQVIESFSPLKDGAVISLATLNTNRFNIRVDPTDNEVKRVRFSLTGLKPDGSPISMNIWKKTYKGTYNHWESIRPYHMNGDAPNTDKPHPWFAEPGDYKLTVATYRDPRRKHAIGLPQVIRFKIRD